MTYWPEVPSIESQMRLYSQQQQQAWQDAGNCIVFDFTPKSKLEKAADYATGVRARKPSMQVKRLTPSAKEVCGMERDTFFERQFQLPKGHAEAEDFS